MGSQCLCLGVFGQISWEYLHSMLKASPKGCVNTIVRERAGCSQDRPSGRLCGGVQRLGVGLVLDTCCLNAAKFLFYFPLCFSPICNTKDRGEAFTLWTVGGGTLQQLLREDGVTGLVTNVPQQRPTGAS